MQMIVNRYDQNDWYQSTASELNGNARLALERSAHTVWGDLSSLPVAFVRP